MKKRLVSQRKTHERKYYAFQYHVCHENFTTYIIDILCISEIKLRLKVHYELKFSIKKI